MTSVRPADAARDRWATVARDAGKAIRNRWNEFFELLFAGWGYQDAPRWARERPDSPQAITARVDAKLAEQRAAKDAPAVPPVVERDDRPRSEPQDLDAIAADTPPPPMDRGGLGGYAARPSPLTVDVDPNERWCICEGNAHDANCVARRTTSLSTGGFLPPPPMSANE